MSFRSRYLTLRNRLRQPPLTAQAIHEAWLQSTLDEWAMGVDALESQGEARITQYFDVIGWRWALRQAGIQSYSESARTRHPGLLNYCGIGLAFTGLRLGQYLDPIHHIGIAEGVAYYCLPGVPRMHDPSRWEAAELARLMPRPGDEAQRGDILTVTTTGRREIGDHFCQAVEVDREKRVIQTVEFNAMGVLDSLGRGRGCVQRERDFDAVRGVWRFGRAYMERKDWG
jgi:hypothetical protein